MSSGFVSGGTIEDPAERDDAWRKAQEELAESRRLKDEQAHQNGGKSLFEVLEANKAAKQEAFEEAAKFKNQYRGLDDSEAEFIDSVLEATRKKEAAVRKETLEQLEVFRRQQEEAERKALEAENAGPAPAEDTHWVAGGRKRKKGNDKDGGLLKGVKLRRATSSSNPDPHTASTNAQQKAAAAEKPASSAKPVAAAEKPTSSAKTVAAAEKPASPAKTVAAAAPKPPSAVLLGLGYASSDEED